VLPTSLHHAIFGREPLPFDHATLANSLSGRRILVTGAGGSIGSALCESLLDFTPASLVALERSEHELQELADRPFVPVLGDAGDEALLDEVFARYAPEIVFHAAAFKHAPFLEQFPLAAVANNVLAAHRLALAAARYGARSFVSVSTDKAVNPTSFMGATKRVLERLLRGVESDRTAFVSVRFGNVFGSRGSVVPRLLDQIRDLRPATITHPDMARYFTSEREAVGLLQTAAAIGRNGDLLVPDLGEPVRIVDLARALAADDALPIVFTGLRPGEKLVEELVGNREQLLPTGIPFLRRVADAAPLSSSDVARFAAALEAAVRVRDAREAVRLVRLLVPEYTPSDVVLARLESLA